MWILRLAKGYMKSIEMMFLENRESHRRGF